MKKKLPLLFLVATCAIFADGASLYQERCSTCHGADGQQKAMRKANPVAGMSTEEVSKNLNGYKDGSLNKYGMAGLMRAQVKSYTQEQIQMVSKYISTLPNGKTAKSQLAKATTK